MINRQWIKRLCLLLAAVLLSAFAGTALADDAAWVCPNCGATGNAGNFCPNCGSAKPDNGEWTCPTCGRTGNTGNFCENCATKRPAGRDWPVLSELYPPVDVYMYDVADESQRRQSYTGPSKAYTEAGAFKPYKVQHVTAYFIENGSVFVHLQYQTVTERFLFFPKWNLGGTNYLPEVDQWTKVPAVTPQKTIPRWGPGSEYTDWKDYSTRAGQQVSVLFEENGYVYAEYTCSKGQVRMWLPADSVQKQP